MVNENTNHPIPSLLGKFRTIPDDYGSVAMKHYILKKNWLIVIIFILILTGCLPKSKINIKLLGPHNHEFSGRADVTFCSQINSETEKISIIHYLDSDYSVVIYLLYTTSIGKHNLSSEIDRVRNYGIHIVTPYLPIGTNYSEPDLIQGTITIDHFDKDYSGGIVGSFEAEFNDGLMVEGEFDIDYRGQGTDTLDFSCFHPLQPRDQRFRLRMTASSSSSVMPR